MFVLDTNVLSELQRPHKTHPRVLRNWIDRQVLATIAGRILPADAAAAQRCAALHVPNPAPSAMR